MTDRGTLILLLLFSLSCADRHRIGGGWYRATWPQFAESGDAKSDLEHYEDGHFRTVTKVLRQAWPLGNDCVVYTSDQGDVVGTVIAACGTRKPVIVADGGFPPWRFDGTGLHLENADTFVKQKQLWQVEGFLSRQMIIEAAEKQQRRIGNQPSPRWAILEPLRVPFRIDPNSRLKDGRCRLIAAFFTEYGSGPIRNQEIRNLLEAGADPDCRDKDLDDRPLGIAADKEDNDVIAILLEFGANPNLQGWKGQTPLMLTAGWGDEVGVRLLIDHGADPNIRDDDGRTVYARLAASPEKTAILRNAIDRHRMELSSRK